MRYIIFSLVLGLLSCGIFKKSPKEISTFESLHEKYLNNWFKGFSFIQQTDVFKKDSLIKSSIWYEVGSFPSLFRIDFDAPKSGNAVVYRNDSVYVYRNNKIASRRAEFNKILYIMGGMYSDKMPIVRQKFDKIGIDIRKQHIKNYKGQSVFVVGDESNPKGALIYFDKNKHVPLLYSYMQDDNRLKILFEEHRFIKGFWIEKIVKFYLNDQLAQIEYYNDYIVDPSLEPKMFSASELGCCYWK
jgi:hypothetical protein